MLPETKRTHSGPHLNYRILCLISTIPKFFDRFSSKKKKRKKKKKKKERKKKRNKKKKNLYFQENFSETKILRGIRCTQATKTQGRHMKLHVWNFRPKRESGWLSTPRSMRRNDIRTGMVDLKRRGNNEVSQQGTIIDIS